MSQDPAPADDSGIGGTLGILLVAAVGGLVVGLVAGTFRWCLLEADAARVSLLDHLRELPGPTWLVPMAGVAGCTALARYIVRHVPAAEGSGIQDVEAIWRGEAEAPDGVVLPAKFVGGLLSIGSGLALGREGPTVHMGAVIGAEAGRRLRVSETDRRILLTAFGGAGLAVAFNAPLGGALFVFEEVTKTFRTRLVLATLVGCATAIASSRIILPDVPDFLVAPLARPPTWQIAVFAVFGLATGFLGALYNRLIMGALALSDRTRRMGPEVQAAAIGAVVGLMLFVDPLLSGDGYLLTESLLRGGVALLPVAGYAVVRFVIGPISYATGTPGGLFAPLLAVGALWGILCHAAIQPLVPGISERAAPFAIIGMAAFFTAVVRSPLTGIVLVAEMTATTTLFVPMFAAVFAALLATTIVRSEPIYTSLWARMLEHADTSRPGTGPGPVTPRDDGSPP